MKPTGTGYGVGAGVDSDQTANLSLCEVCGQKPAILLHPTATRDIECETHGPLSVHLLVCRDCYAKPIDN